MSETPNTSNPQYDRLSREVAKHQEDISRIPATDNPAQLVEFLHLLSSLQARAGAIVGEASLLRGQMEAEFLARNTDNFHVLPPTKFSMLMNAELYRYKALCIAADRLESDITHIADNLRTEISYLKTESMLASSQR